MKINFIKSNSLKQKPDESALGFGKFYTDYMFVMDYTEGTGWHDARITPYAPLQIDPATMVLHYAQETFEGLKAYRNPNGEVTLFRPEMNAKRMNVSNSRLCMPEIPVEDFIQAVKELVKVEQDWVPNDIESSLYIRPFVFSTEPGVGVRPSNSYKFMIILTPVGNYYPEGINPVKIWVEQEYVRAAIGGTGFIKCGGNYASSLAAQVKAKENGCTQVLWLDGFEHKYVEEVGTMNAMFLINDTVVTAALKGSILAGITRDSIIHILKNWGYKVEERDLAIDELINAAKDGSLKEAFGTGTAAVISPIGSLTYDGNTYEINGFETGSLTEKLYTELTGIQRGLISDKFNWNTKV